MLIVLHFKQLGKASAFSLCFLFFIQQTTCYYFWQMAPIITNKLSQTIKIHNFSRFISTVWGHAAMLNLPERCVYILGFISGTLRKCSESIFSWKIYFVSFFLLWWKSRLSFLELHMSASFPAWSVSMGPWCNCKESTLPQFSHIFWTTPPTHPCVLCSGRTQQLLSLYCFLMPRSLHKTLKEHLKRELKLQLSIRTLEQLHITVTVMCRSASYGSRPGLSLQSKAY